MDSNRPIKDRFNESFYLLAESIRNRNFQDVNSNSTLTKEIDQLENESFIQSNNNDLNRDLEEEFDYESNDSYYNGSESNIEDCLDEQEMCRKNEPLKANFTKALKNLIQMYNKLDLDSETKNFRAPPVPVTSRFRRYNPEASNVFDFHTPIESYSYDLNDNTGFTNFLDSLFRDSVQCCLISKEQFDKHYNSVPLQFNSLQESIKSEGVRKEEFYKIIRVLFSWYLSGYYTGRMEVLTRSNNVF